MLSLELQDVLEKSELVLSEQTACSCGRTRFNTVVDLQYVLENATIVEGMVASGRLLQKKVAFKQSCVCGSKTRVYAPYCSLCGRTITNFEAARQYATQGVFCERCLRTYLVSVAERLHEYDSLANQVNQPYRQSESFYSEE